MATYNSEDLMKATIAKFNEILNAGDKNAPANNQNFISWCTPGIPFLPEDFNFLEKGLAGKDGEETAILSKNAALFFNFADMIPDPSAIYDMKQGQTLDRNSQEKLTYMYENMLKLAKVSNVEATPIELKKMAAAEKLLIKTVSKTFPVMEIDEESTTDDENIVYKIKTIKKGKKDIMVTEKRDIELDSPQKVAYDACQQLYNDALLEYNNKRVSALAGLSSAAVLDFNLNGDMYYNKVRNATNNWIAKGKKNQIESASATISQIAQRNMALWFADLKENLAKQKMSDALVGTFYPTFLYPTSFMKNSNWPRFSFGHSETDYFSKKNTTEWDAHAGGGFGPFSAKIKASGSNEQSNANFSANAFKMEFELCTVKIIRPHIRTELFTCQGWKLDNQWEIQTGSKPLLSDGNNPPAGSFIAYSTHAVFARSLKVTFDESSWQTSSMKKALELGGEVSYGPFNVGGNYKKGDEERSVKTSVSNAGFECAGAQLIGFINRQTGKLPNPSPFAKFDE